MTRARILIPSVLAFFSLFSLSAQAQTPVAVENPESSTTTPTISPTNAQTQTSTKTVSASDLKATPLESAPLSEPTTPDNHTVLPGQPVITTFANQGTVNVDQTSNTQFKI